MTDFGEEPFGVSPDTIVNFAPAEINVLYVQQIDVKVPENGAFLGELGASLTVDSASVASISNLPPGLTYECADFGLQPCTFPGGSLGCAVLSGIPTQGGTYDIEVTLTVHGSSFLGPLSLPFVVEGYTIEVSDPLSANSAGKFSFDLGPNVPNPADNKTTLSIIAPNTSKGELTVFDLVGKPVIKKSIRLNSGRNDIAIDTSLLPTGLYVYRVDAFGETLSSRFVVAR